MNKLCNGTSWKTCALPSKSRAFGISIVVAILVVAFQSSPAGKSLKLAWADRLLYSLRETLEQAPDIHPNLKIYGMDDQAVARTRRADLGLADWAAIIANLSRSMPRAIVIDRKFDPIKASPQEIEAFKAVLLEAPPVIVGSFTREQINRWATPLDLLRKEFQLSDMRSSSSDPGETLNWLPIQDRIPYGPDPRIAAFFPRIGHFNYEGNGRIQPFTRLSRGVAIPHIALLAGPRLQVDEIGVKLDDKRLPLGPDGHLIVDFPALKQLYGRTMSMLPLIVRSRKGKPITSIKRGDTVLIMPRFFTGNADMGMTPLGRLPRGFVVASVLNSTLYQSWLQPLPGEIVFIGLAAVTGAVIALCCGTVLYWFVLLGLGLMIVTASVASFSYAGVMAPWFGPVCAMFLSGTIVYTDKMRIRDRISRALELTLGGLVSQDVLQKMIRNPTTVNRVPSERLITVMFVDIVGFSSVAEREHPRIVFERLKNILGRFSKTVHLHGGIVDKSLGDGLLCFFGYDYTGVNSMDNHADQAIHCAIQIQRDHLLRNLIEHEKGTPIMPLRIGINTALIYVGDIGDSHRIDFTIVGDGVNYAQRLESACRPYAIMMSEMTLRAATSVSADDPSINRRQIRIKHHEDLYNVIELDPFFENRIQVERALRGYRRSRNLERRYIRWSVDDPSVISVTSNQGPAILVDFSLKGLSLRLDHFLATGVTVSLVCDSSDGLLRTELMHRGIEEIVAEVRWGRPIGGKFHHGLAIKNLTEDDLDELYGALRIRVIKAAEEAGTMAIARVN